MHEVLASILRTKQEKKLGEVITGHSLGAVQGLARVETQMVESQEFKGERSRVRHGGVQCLPQRTLYTIVKAKGS